MANDRALRSQPAVSVVIPARNAAGTISRTLAALATQDLSEPFEVIVVDDASDDDTVAVIEAAQLEVRVVHGEGGRAGAARNLGAGEAAAPVLAFTDADCFPSPNWLRKGLTALRGFDLVQGRVEPDRSQTVGVLDRTLRIEEETGRFETANLFVTREVFERIGGFEDWLFTPAGMTYGEDTLFGWRLRRRGGKTTFSHEVEVEHAVFLRGPRGRLAEGLNMFCIPALVGRIPELRRAMLFCRYFLNDHTARFDLVLLVLLLRRRLPKTFVALGLAPYASWLLPRAATQWPNSALVLGTDVATDFLVLGALGAGSVRNRTLVL